MLLNKYKKIREEKDSILCVGIDPLMQKFTLDNMDENILNFCMDIVEQTADYACAFKPNSQFILFALDMLQLQQLNDLIHERGCISILDHKLGDIGTTNLSALYWIKETGFDAFTFSPYAGNINEITTKAHNKGLGVFVLTLMSNPESAWIQKEFFRNGVPLFLDVADVAGKCGSDGVVVGATENVSEEDMKEIRRRVGSEAIFLVPGIGAQGGDAEKAIRSGGENILINVGRSIIDEINPREKAKEYQQQFNKYRK